MDERQAQHIDEVEHACAASGVVRLALGTPDSETTAGRLADYADVGAAVDTPRGDRNVRVGTPDGAQLTFYGPHANEEQERS